MSGIEERLKRIADAHGDETEMMIYLFDDGDVHLHVGNPVNCVLLGEVEGENKFEGKGVEQTISFAEKFYNLRNE